MIFIFDLINFFLDIILWILYHLKLIVGIIVAIFVIAFISGIVSGVKESKIKLPDFPEVNKDGLKLMKTVEFTLSGVNHVHDGSDTQKVIKSNLKGEWLTLKPEPENQYDDTAVKVLYNGQYIGWLPASFTSLTQDDAKKMIFKRLMNGMEVLARFDNITTVQVGGYDLDDMNPEIDKHIFNSAIVTCAIYELPKKRHVKLEK